MKKSSVQTLFPDLGLKHLLGASVSNFKVNNKKFYYYVIFIFSVSNSVSVFPTQGTSSPRFVEDPSSPMTALLPQLLPQPMPETLSTPGEEQRQQQEELDRLQVEEEEIGIAVDGAAEVREEEKLEEDQELLVELGEYAKEMEEEKPSEETAKVEENLIKMKQTKEPYQEEQATGQLLHFEPVLEDTPLLPLPAELQEQQQPHVGWQLSSSSSDELGMPNIEGEDLTLIHVPIEDLGFSLTGESGVILSDSVNINGCN